MTRKGSQVQVLYRPPKRKSAVTQSKSHVGSILTNVLAYTATKSAFLQDAPEIAEIVRTSVQEKLGINISRESGEYRSWNNSLGNAMFHVLNSSDIPDAAGVAIEYRLHGRGQRIDFMVSGYDENQNSSLVLIELKQWDSVQDSELADHVQTFLNGGVREVSHPSYQSWSYGRLLHDFYEYVTSDPIVVSTGVYMHNLLNAEIIKAKKFSHLLLESPVFLSGQSHELRGFIRSKVSEGDSGAVIRRVEDSPVKPSKQLVQAPFS